MRTVLFAVCLALPCAAAPVAEPEEAWWWHRIGEVPVGVIRELTEPTAAGGSKRTEIAELRPWQGGGERVTKWRREWVENGEGHLTGFTSELSTPGDDGQDVFITVNGTVTGDGYCTLKAQKHGEEAKSSQINWPAGVLGPIGEARLRLSKGFAPGTKYSYLSWDFETGRVISNEVLVETDAARLDGPGGAATAARLAVRGLSPASPALLEWWADGKCLRRWTQTLGDASRVRVEKEEAVGRGTGVVANYSVCELCSVRAGAPQVPRPSAVTNATWRLRVTSGDLGGLELVGPGQVGKAATDGSWVVQTTAGRLPKGGPRLPLTVPDDIKAALGDTYWTGLDGTVIPEAAKAIVGSETSAARAVEKIVAAVAERLRPTALNAGIATAYEAWRQREGDCLEHATCVVALCRAVGIPARIAGGLRLIGGRLLYHAWNEVWVGDWVSVDAMTPDQQCDAARIRFGTGWLVEASTPEDALINVGTAVKRLDVELVEASVGKVRCGSATAQISGRQFQDPLWGVRITVTGDFQMQGADPTVQATIAVARGKRGRRINVRAGTVGLHEGPWELARQARDNGGFEVLNARAIDVDGVTAVLADLMPLRGAGYSPRTAYVVDGETLFVVEYGGDAADAVAVFERMLADWRWIRSRGK